MGMGCLIDINVLRPRQIPKQVGEMVQWNDIQEGVHVVYYLVPCKGSMRGVVDLRLRADVSMRRVHDASLIPALSKPSLMRPPSPNI